jgi:hypothetical protein
MCGPIFMWIACLQWIKTIIILWTSLTSHIHRGRIESFHIIIIIVLTLCTCLRKMFCREQDARVHEESLGEDERERDRLDLVDSFITNLY